MTAEQAVQPESVNDAAYVWGAMCLCCCCWCDNFVSDESGQRVAAVTVDVSVDVDGVTVNLDVELGGVVDINDGAVVAVGVHADVCIVTEEVKRRLVASTS